MWDVFDNKFYKLCMAENTHIFSFKGEDSIRIPEMTMNNLNEILHKDMKLNKACDIYLLTVEHLRYVYAGEDAKQNVLNLLNDIMNEIYYLTCLQLKKGLSSVVFKGKKKSMILSNLYRRIKVIPQLGSILDRYIDPAAEDIFRGVQSTKQFGFTKNLSYLIGPAERVKCHRWALDNKLTCLSSVQY